MAIENQELEEAKSTSQKLMEDAKVSANKASEEAKRYSKKKMEEGRDLAASELEKVAHAAATAAWDLSDQRQETISRYVNDLADRVGSLADGLRGKSIDQLLNDAKDMARRNPTLFIAGSVAIGFGLSRFVKASARRLEESAPMDDAFVKQNEMFGSGESAPW